MQEVNRQEEALKQPEEQKQTIDGRFPVPIFQVGEQFLILLVLPNEVSSCADWVPLRYSPGPGES